MQINVSKWEGLVRGHPELIDELIAVLRFGCPARYLPDLTVTESDVGAMYDGATLDVWVSIQNIGTATYRGSDPAERVEVLVEISPQSPGVFPARGYVDRRFPLDVDIPTNSSQMLHWPDVQNVQVAFQPSPPIGETQPPDEPGLPPGSAGIQIAVCIDPENTLIELRKDNNDVEVSRTLVLSTPVPIPNPGGREIHQIPPRPPQGER